MEMSTKIRTYKYALCAEKQRNVNKEMHSGADKQDKQPKQATIAEIWIHQ